MVLNRRHKALLFITLVITGCSLLLGAELKDALGFLMLGAAFAWAVGSDTASKLYVGLKRASNSFYAWVRLPLAMSFAGVLLGAVLLYSRANPVLAVATMCVAGIFTAPLTALPTLKMWQRIPRYLLGIMGFVFAAFGIIETDLIMSNKYGGRFGQLIVTAVVAFLVGIMWLSKGWELIEKGISAQPSLEAVTAQQEKRVWPQYVSLFLGVTILTLWVSTLAWLGSSDWAYAPSEVVVQKKNDSNLLVQAGLIVLLAWWPYASWRSILNREPNSDLKFLKRHKRVSALAGMIFVVVLGLAITFSIQNGNDRIMTDEVTAGINNLKAVASKIVTIKQRDLKTTEDYIQAYKEIDSLLPEFDSKVQNFSAMLNKLEQSDQSRGAINIQRFYKSYATDFRKNLKDIANALREDVSLTRKETEAARNMAELPTQSQVAYWQKEFQPLLAQEDALREQLRALAAKQAALNK